MRSNVNGTCTVIEKNTVCISHFYDPPVLASDVTRPLKVGGCKICEKSDGLGCRSFDTAVAV